MKEQMFQDFKNEIINKIQEIELEYCKKIDCKYVCSECILDSCTKKAIDSIKGYNSEKWIPVSEKVPSDASTVFVTYIYGEKYTDIGNAFYSSGRWFFLDEVQCPVKIIAWMPYPEPYEEDKEKL